ncbi:hypothetical protein [Polaribacter sp. IC073]|uniref:hypothetical protein n=1 Tax=Polaribacter sp. IC073 TaxID=2508540 RepID=UPI0011BEEED1|nr:hypothetical protein [Polaribacter sp. IC073]TXD48652.1 hypothetical protein ES045_05350 [Polaribacter sp. IC073]
MDNSIFLAKFWGWYLLIFFFILTFNPRRSKQIIKDLHDEKFLIMASFISIIMGLLNILFHNIWEFNYKLLITLIGWTSLFIGLSLFVIPKNAVAALQIINIKLVQVIYALLFFTGLFLLNIAYRIILI